MTTNPRKLTRQDGFVLVFTMLLLVIMGSMGLMLVSTTGREQAVVRAEMGKLKAFYASEGVMNLICQQAVNGKAEKYMSTSGSTENFAEFAHLEASSEGSGTWDNYDDGREEDKWGNYVQMINDNDEMTYWRSADRNGVDTVSLFFGRNRIFTKVTLSYKGGAPTGIHNHTLLYFSTDGVWETITSGNGNPQQFTFTPAVGSAVRLVMDHVNEHSRISEFGVYDDGYAGSPTWTVADMKVDVAVSPKGNGWVVTTDGYLEKAGGKVEYSAPLKQFFVPSFISSYPEFAYVPCIFYDYKCDGSNPNFQIEISNEQGQIQNALDSYRKPQLLADLLYNNCLEQWFWPSNTNGCTAGNRDQSVKFIFDGEEGRWRWAKSDNSKLDNRPDGVGGTVTGEFVGPNWDPTDPMANIIIPSMLVFKLIDTLTGTYQFYRDGWNPLSARGWGLERCDGCDCDESYEDYISKSTCTCTRGVANLVKQRRRNYAYTMEMHSKFIYKGNETFTFEGDDDVWLFINNHLVIDIGGVHQAQTESITLDATFANNHSMNKGEEYSFDFFYCERRTHDATCRITTNIDIMGLYKTMHTNWRKDYGNL